MNKFGFLFIAFCLVLSLVSPVSAQNNDFASWNALSIEHDVFSDFSLGLNQEIRLSDNASFLSDYVTEVELGYKINKHWQFACGYRLQKERDIKGGSCWTQRFYSDLQYKIKMSRFSVKLRERFQYEPAYYGEDEWSYYSFMHLRHKLGLKYDIKGNKLNPFLDLEWYQSLNNPRQNRIVKQRYTIGVDYPLLDWMDIELMFRYQYREDLIHKPKQDYIGGISLKIEV